MRRTLLIALGMILGAALIAGPVAQADTPGMCTTSVFAIGEGGSEPVSLGGTVYWYAKTADGTVISYGTTDDPLKAQQMAVKATKRNQGCAQWREPSWWLGD